VHIAAQLFEINRFSDRHFWHEDYEKAKTLAKLCGCGLNTVKRALDDLQKGRWIQVVQLGPTGTVNAYVVNSRVAWCDVRDNKKMALFSARVVADVEDQSEQVLRPLISIAPRFS
jgi:hypothetical protein